MGCSESNTKSTDKPSDKQTQQQNSNANQNSSNTKVSNQIPKVIFVVGGPGSGKGTQCAELVKHKGFVHISTGDLLRAEKDSGSSLAAEINKVMSEGKLVSTSILIKLMLQAMNKLGSDKTFLIDGFPRNFENIDLWNKEVKAKKLAELKMVIYFEVDKDVMRERLTSRGKTSGRVDDNPETIEKRLNTFYNESVPVVESLEKEGLVKRVDSGREISEVTNDVLSLFVPKVIFVVGGPGSGKGTQCTELVKHKGFVHISTGDLLRAEKDSGSKLAAEINKVMSEGKLVSTSILIKLMLQEMEKIGYMKTFLIDGFPRNFENIDLWDKEVRDKNLAEVIMVIYFEVEKEVMRSRLSNRGKTSGRADDNPETIEKRLNTFYTESVPVVDKLEESGLVRRVDSGRDVKEVTQDVLSLF